MIRTLLIVFLALPCILAGCVIQQPCTNCVCLADQGGKNDFTGQKDLTQFCFDGQQPIDEAGVHGFVDYWVSYSATTISGGSTLDFCIILDTNRDRGVDKALCVDVNAALRVLPTWFTCSNSKPRRCTQSAPLASPPATTCEAYLAPTDPFTCGANNLVVHCNITLVANGTINLFGVPPVDICSAPSASPTSNPSDCIFRACSLASDCGTPYPCYTPSCTSGSCGLDAVVCNDNNKCTSDKCDPSAGCQFTPFACNDGNACTVDSCDPVAGCKTSTLNCDDGNACTVDGCNPSTGCTRADVVCNDNNLCTTDSCNPATGCTTTRVVCDDSNECTVDSCVSTTGCSYTQIDCPCQNSCLNAICISKSPESIGGGTCVGKSCCVYSYPDSTAAALKTFVQSLACYTNGRRDVEVQDTDETLARY